MLKVAQKILAWNGQMSKWEARRQVPKADGCSKKWRCRICLSRLDCKAVERYIQFPQPYCNDHKQVPVITVLTNLYLLGPGLREITVAYVLVSTV